MDKRPSSPGVFLDACVLYPGLLRGILLRLAEAGLINPRWSPRVLAEWRIAAARNGGLSAEDEVQAITARMTARFPDAGIDPDPEIEQSLTLPDPADTHVLAAAIAAGAGVLLTFNLRDFPVRRLAAHGIAARHPDGFLWQLFSDAPDTVGQAVRETTTEIGSTDLDAARRALKRARLSRLSKAWFAGQSNSA